MSLEELSNAINVVPNFPKEGIFFRDISPLLKNVKLRNKCFELLENLVKNVKIDYIAGIESRGFILGMGLACKLGVNFVMLRKPNKMPNTIEVSYGLEYGKDILTIQKDSIEFGKNVLIVDDLLATGGTLLAGCNLVEQLGANIVGCLCLVELTGLIQNEKLNKYKLFSLLKYPSNSKFNNLTKEDLLFNKNRIEYLSKDNFSITNDKYNDYGPVRWKPGV